MATNDTGATLLHEVRDADAAQVILAALSPKQRHRLLAEADQDGYTALHVAAGRRDGGPVCMAYIATELMDINSEDMRSETPLFRCV